MSLHLEDGDHSSASRSKSSWSIMSSSLKRFGETCRWIWRSDCQLDLRPMERLVEERNGQNSAPILSRTEHPNKIFEVNCWSFLERVRIDPKSQNSGQIPHGWTVTPVMLFPHLIKRSISEGGLVAGGMATQSGRQNLLLHSCEPCEQFDAHSSH